MVDLHADKFIHNNDGPIMMAENYSTWFADPASDWLVAIVDLHDQIIFYLLIEWNKDLPIGS